MTRNQGSGGKATSCQRGLMIMLTLDVGGNKTCLR